MQKYLCFSCKLGRENVPEHFNAYETHIKLLFAFCKGLITFEICPKGILGKKSITLRLCGHIF